MSSKASRPNSGRLQRFVEEAYVVSQDLRALVTTLDTDSVRIGELPPDLAPHITEINEAVVRGTAVSSLFGPFPAGGISSTASSVWTIAMCPSTRRAMRSWPFGCRRISGSPSTDFRQKAIAGSLVAALVAALMAWFLATTITGPLNRLGRVAIRIQRGRMDEPVQKERGGELGRLSRAMERMRVGILHRDEQLRLMLAQVAHEIRNPLGGLELFASAAAESDDPEERSQFIGKVRDEITALNRIIDDFLTFARPLRPEGELHDIRLPVEEAVELVEMEMRDSGDELTLDLPGHPLMAKADPRACEEGGPEPGPERGPGRPSGAGPV